MRPISYFFVGLLALILSASWTTGSLAADYNARFEKNYPPGYYGMWYKAERFYHNPKDTGRARGEQRPMELYMWDHGMSQISNLWYPFLPVPYEWDYGTYKDFNLPNYNSNNWN